jgi:hypothetical protein
MPPVGDDFGRAFERSLHGTVQVADFGVEPGQCLMLVVRAEPLDGLLGEASSRAVPPPRSLYASRVNL